MMTLFGRAVSLHFERMLYLQELEFDNFLHAVFSSLLEVRVLHNNLTNPFKLNDVFAYVFAFVPMCGTAYMSILFAVIFI